MSIFGQRYVLSITLGTALIITKQLWFWHKAQYSTSDTRLITLRRERVWPNPEPGSATKPTCIYRYLWSACWTATTTSFYRALRSTCRAATTATYFHWSFWTTCRTAATTLLRRDLRSTCGTAAATRFNWPFRPACTTTTTAAAEFIRFIVVRWCV